MPLVASTATLPSTDVDDTVLVLIYTEISKPFRVLPKVQLLLHNGILELDPMLCLFLGVEHDELTHGYGIKS